MAEKDLKALFLHQLKDTYFAENAILKSLPELAEAAQSEELKGALAVHVKETEEQTGFAAGARREDLSVVGRWRCVIIPGRKEVLRIVGHL